MTYDIDDVPMPPGPSNDRVRGMLLGVAIGDALGNTTESINPPQRENEHGEIRDYLPNPRASDRAIGLPSDETQLAFWALESLLDRGHIDPEHLLELYEGREIIRPGHAVERSVDAYRYGAEWREAGEPSAGNGALSRMPVAVLPHIPNPDRQLWEDVVFMTMITHHDEMAVVSGVGLTGMLIETLGASPERATGEWWIDVFTSYARPVESGDETYPSRSPKLEFEGTLCQMLDEHVRRAAEGFISVVDACDSWYSGAYLLETIPSALLVLARHAGDPEEAVIRAVNDTRDSDTVGAVVGAVVGALHGASAFPDRWLGNLTGRTAEDDDGRVEELIDAALDEYGLERMSG